MSEKQKDIQTMVDLLRQGAILTGLSCPSCSSPLFRLQGGDLWCAQCQKRVIVVKDLEKPTEATTPMLFDNLELTILKKIQEVNLKIDGETKLEELQKLSDILFVLLKNLDRVKRMKKG